jgi:hypothetical protein
MLHVYMVCYCAIVDSQKLMYIDFGNVHTTNLEMNSNSSHKFNLACP